MMQQGQETLKLRSKLLKNGVCMLKWQPLILTSMAASFLSVMLHTGFHQQGASVITLSPFLCLGLCLSSLAEFLGSDGLTRK